MSGLPIDFMPTHPSTVATYFIKSSPLSHFAFQPATDSGVIGSFSIFFSAILLAYLTLASSSIFAIKAASLPQTITSSIENK